MALISKNRPNELARPIAKMPHDDPDAVGFGTTLTKVFADLLDAHRTQSPISPRASGPASGSSSSGKSWVRKSAHRQAANRAASGRSVVPQA
jgi:hypothetical protein